MDRKVVHEEESPLIPNLPSELAEKDLEVVGVDGACLKVEMFHLSVGRDGRYDLPVRSMQVAGVEGDVLPLSTVVLHLDGLAGEGDLVEKDDFSPRGQHLIHLFAEAGMELREILHDMDRHSLAHAHTLEPDAVLAIDPRYGLWRDDLGRIGLVEELGAVDEALSSPYFQSPLAAEKIDVPRVKDLRNAKL